MNILHLVDEPYDSGIVHYALTVASGLKARGHSIHFGGKKDSYALKEAVKRGFETFATAGFPSCISCLRQYLRKRKIDLINAHTGSAHATAVTATRFLPDAPPIVRTRGDSRPVHANPGAGLIWNRTTGFIAAAQYIQKQFHSAFPRIKIPTSIVDLGIDDFFPDGAHPEPSTGETLRIGIVARLDPVKGHVFLLKSIAKVLREAPGAVLVVVGREENVRASHLHSVASGLGITKSVEFLGHIPDPFEVMRLCHVGIISSIGSEAISRVALEWMSVGRPIIATRVGCLPEVVLDQQTGFLVNPKDPDAMAQRLIELLRNADLRRRMGLRARERFANHFTLPHCTEKTERFYEEILHPVSPR